jgi:hypothetical protein
MLEFLQRSFIWILSNTRSQIKFVWKFQLIFSQSYTENRSMRRVRAWTQGGHSVDVKIIHERWGNLCVSLYSYSFRTVFVRNTFLYKYTKACLQLLWREIHNLNISNHSPSPSDTSAMLYNSGWQQRWLLQEINFGLLYITTKVVLFVE